MASFSQGNSAVHAQHALALRRGPGAYDAAAAQRRRDATRLSPAVFRRAARPAYPFTLAGAPAAVPAAAGPCAAARATPPAATKLWRQRPAAID